MSAKRLLWGLAAALLAAIYVFTGSSLSGFSATVTNTANSAGTAPYFTCAAAAGENGALPATDIIEDFHLNEPSGSTTAIDYSGNSRNGTYQGSMTSDTTSTPACPRDPGGAYVLDGSTSYMSTAAQLPASNVFSIEAWFKTTTPGGMLVGFGNQQTGLSSEYDRHIYMTNSGQLVFGVYPGAVQTIQTPAAYDNGQWHQVVATLSPAGMDLYVDGTLIASNPSVTTAQPYSGYWRIGYDNLNGWPNPPSDFHFKGELRFVTIYSTALTPAQVAADYTAGS